MSSKSGIESRTEIQLTRNILVKGFKVYILSARSGMNFGRENAGEPKSSYDPLASARDCSADGSRS